MGGASEQQGGISPPENTPHSRPYLFPSLFLFVLFCFVLFFGTVFLFQIADVRLVATSVGKQERRCSVILKRLLCRVEQ